MTITTFNINISYIKYFILLLLLVVYVTLIFTNKNTLAESKPLSSNNLFIGLSQSNDNLNQIKTYSNNYAVKRSVDKVASMVASNAPNKIGAILNSISPITSLTTLNCTPPNRIAISQLSNKELIKLNNKKEAENKTPMKSTLFPFLNSQDLTNYVLASGIAAGFHMFYFTNKICLEDQRAAVFAQVETLRLVLGNKIDEGNISPEDIILCTRMLELVNKLANRSNLNSFGALSLLDMVSDAADLLINAYEAPRSTENDINYVNIHSNIEVLLTRMNNFSRRFDENRTILEVYKDIFDHRFNVNNNNNHNFTLLDSKNTVNELDLMMLEFTTIWTTLSTPEIHHLINILFITLIMSLTIRIIILKFGNYLIIHFNLKSKYPKLAKLIQFRITFIRWAIFCNYIFLFFTLVSFIFFNCFS